MSYRPSRYVMSNEEHVRRVLSTERQRWDAPANVSVIVSRLKEDATTDEIRSAIDRLGDERRIILNPAVQAALDAAKERHLLNDFRAQAFEKMILDKATELGWDLTSAQNLSDICDWLLENQDVPLTEKGREAQQQLRGVEKRTDEINQITNNYTSGFKIRTANGGTRVFGKDGHEILFSSQGGRAKPRDAGFDGMSDDEISAICEQLRTERRMRSMTKEGLRAEINPAMKQAWIDKSKHLQPTPLGVQLINPDTRQVIDNKRDLIRFINSGRDNTKRLLQRRGETDKTLARIFESILNS